MFDFLTFYWTWLMSFDSVLLTMLMMFVSAIGVLIAAGMLLTLILVPLFMVLKFFILTPIGWVLVGLLLWGYYFQHKDRTSYGLDPSFLENCAGSQSCAQLLQARDNLTLDQLDKVTPSDRITAVQE